MKLSTKITKTRKRKTTNFFETMAMCTYLNCTSVQKPFCSLAFFSLPKDSRRQLWIENSGNTELANLSETARRVVCQKHFNPDSLRIQFHRTTLSRDAVPKRWDADLNNSSSVVEPIEISENDDYGEVNKDYGNPHVDDSEGIEFVDIEDDSQGDRYAVDTIKNHEIDQQSNHDEIIILEDPPTHFDEVEIEQANNHITTITSPSAVDKSPVRITKQNLSKPPDELMELSDDHLHNDMAATSEILVSSSTSNKSNENPSTSEHINEEDKYFALALAGILQRISPQKKAFAKVNILRYLTELEYGREAKIN